ncbi:hypothetical protein AHMF7605_02650 [Adhaeribacter arboris]|uniref:Uncharacterized protein n=1 Tax=Adhaeribacter arboris TaxID=2072846 RepID=A0A2T2YAE7_9BACT|nr:hypothetical protein [Adhaeribacter arboris]PSR52500.1 hypothetical protein AHMF7605_02650 [Adhaeribacter arboris]
MKAFINNNLPKLLLGFSALVFSSGFLIFALKFNPASASIASTAQANNTEYVIPFNGKDEIVLVRFDNSTGKYVFKTIYKPKL